MRKSIRNIVVKIFCLLLILFSLQMYSEKKSVKAYTTHTVDEAIAWASSKIGQSLEGDNFFGYNNECAYQCVDFIMCYYKYLGVAPSTGNGCDYATNALPSGWTRVRGGQPQRGDILVYSASARNSAGHVAIYESDRSTYHQNFADCKKVTRETFKYNELKNDYWGYIRPDWTTAHNPFGCVDVCESKETGKLHIRGWAIDEDNYGTHLEIHIYIGPENSASGYNIGATNTERIDVDNAYHCGKYHGFDKTIDVDQKGNQRVRIFAINVGGGSNKLLYDRIVPIVSDSEKPEMEGYSIRNLNEYGYTIFVSCHDNVGVTKVKIAIKSEDNTSDMFWYEGNLDNSIGKSSTWKYTFSDGIVGKKYITDVYLYDSAENNMKFSIEPIRLGKDIEKPVIRSSKLYQETPGYVNLFLELTDNYGLGRITRYQCYCFSKDENSGKIIGYDETVKAETCWDIKANCRDIIASEKKTELQVKTACDGIIGYAVSVSDLAGNSCSDKFVWIDGVEVEGFEGNSKEITIKSGETIKIKDIELYDKSYSVSFDKKNERILKKSADDQNENVVLTGNEAGSEYVYFVNLASGAMRSCKIIVKSNKDMGDGIVSLDAVETESPTLMSTESPKPENNNTNDKEFILDPKSSLKIQDGEMLTGISSASNTASEVTEQFLNEADNIIFKDAEGNKIEKTEKVGTGFEIVLLKDGKELKRLVTVVSGDLNGDGVMGNKDVSILAKIFLGKMDGTKAQRMAGDINGDGNLGNKDIALLARRILGKE